MCIEVTTYAGTDNPLEFSDDDPRRNGTLHTHITNTGRNEWGAVGYISVVLEYYDADGNFIQETIESSSFAATRKKGGWVLYGSGDGRGSVGSKATEREIVGSLDMEVILSVATSTSPGGLGKLAKRNWSGTFGALRQIESVTYATQNFDNGQAVIDQVEESMGQPIQLEEADLCPWCWSSGDTISSNTPHRTHWSKKKSK